MEALLVRWRRLLAKRLVKVPIHTGDQYPFGYYSSQSL